MGEAGFPVEIFAETDPVIFLGLTLNWCQVGPPTYAFGGQKLH